MKSLKLASLLTYAVALLHAAIIFGGADWYRFFGAGEELANMQEQGSYYPAILTLAIAILLCIAASYALFGSGFMKPLPFTKPVLTITAMVFLGRGLFAIPLILLVDDPYFLELRLKMPFMIITSVFCFGLGAIFAVGRLSLKTENPPK